MRIRSRLFVVPLALVLVACGGGDSEEPGNGDPSTGQGAYSVIIVDGVDSVTSQGSHDELVEAGFDGFVREGSDDTGYVVYQDGLTDSEAESLLDEIRAELYPEAAEGGLGPGLIVVTDEWFVDALADESNDDAASEGPGNGATVTIGDMTLELALDPAHTCNNFGNLIGGSFAVDSGGNAIQPGGGSEPGGAQFNFTMPVANWEAEGLQGPSIIIDHWDEEIRWIAREDMERGAVEDWELSDGVATGTATFIGEDQSVTGSERADLPEPVPTSGSFEITCVTQ